MEVYYYIPAEDAENAVECGLKLSAWFDKTVMIEGESKRCISALLNPKDDIEKFRSAEFSCLKLELPPKYCFAADKYLYQTGLSHPEVMDMFHNSIIPVEKYIFGSYRLPECLVTTTAIPGQVGILDKRRDSPVLIDNSEELYINNIIETFREEYNDFNDAMLYSFFSRLADEGKVDRIEDSEKRTAIFLDKRNGKVFTIKIPDINKY